MTFDIVIHDCRIVDEHDDHQGWIAITEGRIAAVGDSVSDVPAGRRSIDAEGLVAMPGRIDPHIHIGHAGDFAGDVTTVTRLAAAGGTTTLMPLNRALVSYHEIYPDWAEAVTTRGLADFLIHLQIQIPQHIAEMAEYRERYGTASFKVHLDYRVHDPVVCPLDIGHLDDGDLYLTMEAAAQCGGIVAVHCENTVIALRTTHRVMESGLDGLAAWDEARPSICEVTDINLVGTLAAHLGCKALVVHLSSALGLEAAAKFPNELLAVETVVPFLTMDLTEAEKRVGVAAKMIPPLRQGHDVEALWNGVRNGRISTIGTDTSVLHPSSASGSVWEVGVGSCLMEFALPMLITHGVRAGRLTFSELVKVLCRNPARLYGIDDRKRGLAVGGDADIVLIDTEEERPVSSTASHTGFLTPAEGMRLRGWPKMTFLRGDVTFDGTDVCDAGSGIVLSSTL